MLNIWYTDLTGRRGGEEEEEEEGGGVHEEWAGAVHTEKNTKKKHKEVRKKFAKSGDSLLNKQYCTITVLF